MIARLSYVMCDVCGDPAPCADSAQEARALAKQCGFKRSTTLRLDVCHRCQDATLTLKQRRDN